MASPIGSVGDLVAAIQAQLAGRVGAAPAVARKATPAKRQAGPRKYAQENLGALIAQRVRQIAADDPQRGRKAFRVFLEAVLLSHFGAQMVNDPRFFQMLDDVQGAMEADPASAAMIEVAIGHLLAQPAD